MNLTEASLWEFRRVLRLLVPMALHAAAEHPVQPKGGSPRAGADCHGGSAGSTAREGARPRLDVFDSVKQWKQRRRPPLDDRNVAAAIRNLNLIGWLDLAGSRKLTAVGDGDVDA